MATTAGTITGVVGAGVGSFFGGPAGAVTGFKAGQALGDFGTQVAGNEYQRTYDKQLKDSLKRIRMGQTLAPDQAQVMQQTAGAQQQAGALMQQQQADLQRSAAMGGARSGAFFQAQQAAGQQAADATSRARLAAEMNAQAIGELRRQRALEAAQLRGREKAAEVKEQAGTESPLQSIVAPGVADDSMLNAIFGSASKK